MEYDLADIVSIPSNFVCGTFTDKGFDRKKLFLNHYGTNLTEFVYAPKAHDTFRIVYVGALSIRKGIHYLLEAFKSLNLPSSELWLVGDLEAEAESFFIKYQSDKIKHFKPVSQRNLNLLYNQCDVFAICSIEEGMAMVQAQAMACGLPIICTKNTGGGDLIDDGVSGFVLPIRNVNLLKEKLELFYEDRERIKYMGKMAKIAANNTLSWQNYGKRAVDFYKHINGEISV